METRTTLCQCTRCASVFEWNERKNNRCPECKGIYTVIRFAMSIILEDIKDACAELGVA